MKEYTEKIHRKRLVKMLQRKEPCGCCPAGPYYRGDSCVSFLWINCACDICRLFVGIKILYGCPCSHYTKKKAIELTIKALKKKGDL